MKTRCSAWITIMSICFAAAAAEAQVMVSPKIQSSSSTDQPTPAVLAIHAMDQPDPLLRYRLWPAPQDRLHRNPAPLISRALILEIQRSSDARNEFSELYSQCTELSLDDLPRDQIRTVLDRHSATIRELRRAENLMQLDYDLQLEHLSGPEIIATVLPELQEMRHLGRLLCLRARLAVAEQRWDDFVDDCRLCFRLSEFAGHSTDFLIGRLVGFAISSIMLDVIEEAIQKPECPNLYWALVSLPAERLFETRESLEFESVLMGRVLDAAGPLPNHPIGEIAAREKLRLIVQDASLMLSDNRMANKESSALLAGMYVVTMAEPSRDLLAGTAAWGDRARDLSASEAVLRAARLRYARIRDRWVAWSMLPAEAWDQYDAERKQAFGVATPQFDVLTSLVHGLIPAVNAARNSGRRTSQQRNYLCTIESIRMHAATTGELPDSIENMRPVPAWHDAIAVKPFGYQRSSARRATLTRAARWQGDTETTILLELKGE